MPDHYSDDVSLMAPLMSVLVQQRSCGALEFGPALASRRANNSGFYSEVDYPLDVGPLVTTSSQPGGKGDAPCGIRTLITDLEVAEGAFRKKIPFLIYRPN